MKKRIEDTILVPVKVSEELPKKSGSYICIPFKESSSITLWFNGNELNGHGYCHEEVEYWLKETTKSELLKQELEKVMPSDFAVGLFLSTFNSKEGIAAAKETIEYLKQSLQPKEDKCLYKDHIIELNPNNTYNHKPATYIYYHKDDTDGTENWGETIQECKDSIDDIEYLQSKPKEKIGTLKEAREITSTYNPVYGECAKHPGQSMLNCTTCALDYQNPDK